MPMAPRDIPASVSLDALDMLSVYEGCKCRNVKEKKSARSRIAHLRDLRHSR